MSSTTEETTPLLVSSEENTQHERSGQNSDGGVHSGAANGISIPPVSTDTAKPDDDDPEPGFLESAPRVSMAAVFPPMAIGIFLAAMDNLIVASAYGRISSELHELSKASWLATGYLMSIASIQPLYGKLSDIFGRKSCFLFAYIAFALGSLWCGLARSMDELIIARTFAGIGGGGMTTMGSILMNDLVPLHKRGTWQGIANLVFATGAATGGPVGGILADSIGWRWAFLIQVPLTLFAALMVFIFLRIPHHHPDITDTTVWTKFKRVDFMGAVTIVLAVFSLLVALDLGGKASWTSPAVLITAPTSIALFIVFFWIEARVAKDPFAPPRIVFEKGLISCFLANLFAFAAFMAVIFYIPLYFQAVAALSASQSGLKMLPAIAGSVSGSLSGGLIMQKTGKFYVLTVVAYGIMVVGSVLIFLDTGFVERNFTVIAIGLALMGFGNGIGVTSTLIALIARSGPKDQAVATAISYLFRNLGSMIGVSVASTTMQAALREDLKAELSGRVGKGELKDIMKKATGTLEFLRDLKPEVRSIVIGAYEKAIRYPFLITIGFGVLAIVSSIFIIDQSLKDVRSSSTESSEENSETEYGAVSSEERS